ncbi:alpha/beta hydrolase family protein [Agromyces sp. SYSU T00194]|uniref:alpha/beta hydrolase family protein n=1 Tax=Agromyces chitinivorans TaxID=3158560 RepID=UPI003390D489
MPGSSSRSDASEGARALLGITAGGALAVSAAVAAVGAASALVASFVARAVVTPSRYKLEDTRVVAVDPARHEITLGATPDARMRGEYSFWFHQDTGHARLGDVIETTPTIVRRRLLSVDFGVLATAHRGRFGGWFHLGPWELGHPYRDVVVDTPVGPAPAWLVPAAEDTGRWIIHVHGRAVRRQECLRGVPAAHAAGYTSLVVSYRNDGEAPSGPDGRYRLGDTEWLDVDAAIAYAVAHGAREVVLMGWSMGGATVLQAALRSRRSRETVVGIVLESPAIDWHDILSYQGATYRLPRPLTRLVIAMLSHRWARPFTGLSAPIDFDRLDVVARASEFDVPMLLFHSADDGFVPVAGSDRLAAARPDLITYERFTRARHTKLWNDDPVRWNGALGVWLGELAARRGPAASTAAVPARG